MEHRDEEREPVLGASVLQRRSQARPRIRRAQHHCEAAFLMFRENDASAKRLSRPFVGLPMKDLLCAAGWTDAAFLSCSKALPGAGEGARAEAGAACPCRAGRSELVHLRRIRGRHPCNLIWISAPRCVTRYSTLSGQRGNGFTRPDVGSRKGRIAQLVEQLTLNQRVQGSNPCTPTIDIRLIKFSFCQSFSQWTRTVEFIREFSSSYCVPVQAS